MDWTDKKCRFKVHQNEANDDAPWSTCICHRKHVSTACLMPWARMSSTIHIIHCMPYQGGEDMSTVL